MVSWTNTGKFPHIYWIYCHFCLSGVVSSVFAPVLLTAVQLPSHPCSLLRNKEKTKLHLSVKDGINRLHISYCIRVTSVPILLVSTRSNHVPVASVTYTGY